METLTIVYLIFTGAVFCVLLFLTLFTVEQQTVCMVERFGKFSRQANPGLNFKIPLVERISAILNLRIDQLNVEVETKTEDNVFVKIVVSVQYFILPDRVYEAAYKLENPTKQITSFVFDVVRARVPKIKLDNVFDKKDEIADAVKEELADTMDDFGYGIIKALVTDIDPDPKVKASMNEINAAQRMRIAATEKGEADRILKVKSAEAEAQSKALQGKGIADQRKAIVDGLRDSISQFQDGVSGATAQDVMQLVLMTQYFDTLKELTSTSQSSTVLIPHSPGTLTDLADQIRNAMIVADRSQNAKK